MSYNGSGTFVINTAGQPVVTGTVISSTAFNALTADLGTGLSTAITKDGQTATTARIPFAAGISSALVTDTTSGSTGSIFTAGGIGIAKAVYVGTTATVAGTTDSSSTTTGAIITAGGAGVAKALFVGTTANVAGAVTLQSTLAVGGVATYSAQPIFSSLTASSAVATDASKGLVSVTNTGTGNNVLATSPTLVTPALGTPSALVGTNITGTATAFTASNVTTNANLTGMVTSVGNAASLGSFTSAQLATALTDETGSGANVFGTSPTLTTPIVATTIGVGGATASASGAGITFPATQSASTDANTLDDYEEGTWTPSQGGGLTVVGAFSSSGNYVKVGKVVTLNFSLSGATSITTGAAGTSITTNLPFTTGSVYASGTLSGTANVGYAVFNTFDLGANSGGSISGNSTLKFSITYITS